MDNDTTPLKKCTKCKQEKPLTTDYFAKHKSRKDGHQPICKYCQAEYRQRYAADKPEYDRQYRERNRDKLKKQKQEWQIANTDKIREQKRAYEEAHKSELSEKNKKWYQENRLIHLAKCKAYRLKNSEAISHHRKSIYHSNVEQSRSNARQRTATNRDHYRKLWRAAYYRKRDHRLAYQRSNRWRSRELRKRRYAINPHKVLVKNQNYRAKKRSLEYSFTDVQWNQCLEYFKHCCAVCGRPRGLWHTLAQDHWIPISNPLCPGTTVFNILPLCHGVGGCNNSKGNFEPAEWLMGRYSRRKTEQILERITAYFKWTRNQ